MTNGLYSKIMNPRDAAKYLKISISEIYGLIEKGKFPYVKIEGRIKIPKEEMLDYFFPDLKNIRKEETSNNDLMTKKELSKYLSMSMNGINEIINDIPSVAIKDKKFYSKIDVNNFIMSKTKY